MSRAKEREYDWRAHPLRKRSSVYPGRSINMENDLDNEMSRRSRAAWAAFGLLREATDYLTNLELRAHVLDATVFSALCYVAET